MLSAQQFLSLLIQQFTSDTNCLEFVQIPQVSDSSLRRLPHFKCQPQYPGCLKFLLALLPIADLKFRGSMTTLTMDDLLEHMTHLAGKT